MKERSLTPLPVGFHGDRNLKLLVDALAGRVAAFLETGSNVGSTLGYVARRYPALTSLSCEPHAEACAAAREHACVRDGVDVFEERSQEFLARLANEYPSVLSKPVLAWLDAHDYGFEWPLRDEVRFLTERATSGFLLIDDFKVPGVEVFGFDAYDGQECSFDYVAASIADVDYRLYYPAYTEHTSKHHPLRGWGLIQFGPKGEPLERLDQLLPAVCRHAYAQISNDEAKPAREAASDLFADGDVDGAVRVLRAELGVTADDAGLWNDLGVCLAHLGEGKASLAALAQALHVDQAYEAARANLADVHRAMHRSDDGKPLPIAPGEWGRMTRRDPYADLAAIVDVEAPTIIDGGANKGGTIAKLRRGFPGATIHAFEPISELVAHLNDRFHDHADVHIHGAALAAEGGTLHLHVNNNIDTSSAFSPNGIARRYQGEGVALQRLAEVPTVRLADAVPERIDIVKLDLQGFEIEALRGLGDRLEEVRCILTEVELAPLYEDQPLFADVDAFLRNAGFRLFNLYDVWNHPDGQITAADAIYVNERFYAAA